MEGDRRRPRGGTAGIYRPTGELRTGLVDEIEHSISFHDLIWETPTKSSQAWFVRHFGPEVNLGNIPPDEVIALETLRLGLRADTLKEVLLGVRATSQPPRLPDLDFEAMTAEEVIAWAHRHFWPRVCLTCSWQKQSSVLVHMVAELGCAWTPSSSTRTSSSASPTRRATSSSTATS